MTLKQFYVSSGVLAVILPAAGSFSLSLVPDHFWLTLLLWLAGICATAAHVAMFRMKQVLWLQLAAHLFNINAAWNYIGDVAFTVTYGVAGLIGLGAALVILYSPKYFYAAKGELSLQLRGPLFNLLESFAIGMILMATLVLSFNVVSMLIPFLLWMFGSLLLFTLASIIGEKPLMWNNLLFIAADVVGLIKYGHHYPEMVTGLLSAMLLTCLFIVWHEKRQQPVKAAIF